MGKSERAEIESFVRARCKSDGGVCGRDNSSDLYYTLFGTASLQALKRKNAIPALRLQRYLRSFGTGEGLHFTHLSCLARLSGAYPVSPKKRRAILRSLEQYRSRDGSFSHARRNAEHGTAYGAFLALLAYEDLQMPLPNGQGLLAPTESAIRRKDNTLTTCAAAIVRHQLGAPADPEVGEWLLSQHCEQSGFRATPQTPTADLLSTATTLFALQLLNVPVTPLRRPCLDFVESLWRDSGGFAGYAADTAEDCEYTYYALLSIGCLL